MEAQNEAVLFLSGLLSLSAALIFHSLQRPIISGLTVLTALAVFRYAESEASQNSLDDLDELKILYTQKAVEILVLLTVLLAPTVDKTVGIPVLALIFLGETLREDTEAVSKTLLTPYAGFEFRTAALGIGLIAQAFAEYSVFYAVVVVGVMMIYEITRTLRTGLDLKAGF